MSNEQRNALIIKLLGVVVVVLVLLVVCLTPLRDYPLAVATIPTIVGGVFAAIGFAGTESVITEKLRSMPADKRAEIINKSMRPGAIQPVAITFTGASRTEPAPPPIVEEDETKH